MHLQQSPTVPLLGSHCCEEVARRPRRLILRVVKDCSARAGIPALSPHDCRSKCVWYCHAAGRWLEQIQFLLRRFSVEMTERYLGCNQLLPLAVNDHNSWSRDAHVTCKLRKRHLML
jgi:hypothetical protein